MSFVPPFFSKFGRTSNDILTLKFDAKKDDFLHQASVKTSAKNFSVTSSCVRDGDQLRGKVISRYNGENADITTEYTTAGRIKNTIRSSHLYRGLVLTQETEYKKKDNAKLFDKLTGKVTAEYSQDGFSGSLEYNSASNNVLTSAVFGFDGISIGGAAVVDVQSLTQNTASPKNAVSVDGGIQYENGNIIATATVESNKNVSIGLCHRVSQDLQVASKYIVVPSSDSHSSILSSGFQYRVSPSLLAKGRASVFSDQSYVLYGYLQHRLQNPDLTIGIGGSRDSNNKCQVGVNISFGDF